MSGNTIRTVKVTYIRHTKTFVEVEDGAYLSLQFSEPHVPLIELDEGDEFEIDVPEWLIVKADLDYLTDE